MPTGFRNDDRYYSMPLPSVPEDGLNRLRAARPVFEARARLVDAVRSFFKSRGYLEVETPVRLPVPALELHIDALPSGNAFLRTSPELAMKRLVAAGYSTLFQIGPCFRWGETGRIHHEEFSMLEWYRIGTDYTGIFQETQDLIRSVADQVLGRRRWDFQGQWIDLDLPWVVLEVQEVFKEQAGWDPTEDFDAERFDRDLMGIIEPRFPRDRAVVLRDYPAQLGALARRKPGREHLAERWELYLGGIEIANAFSELTDPVEQRARFADWTAQRQADQRSVYPVDPEFMAALESGLPPTGGIALGLDRLLMVLLNAASLDTVLPFRTPVDTGST
jgi:lysyl-tRNA synthetase class 2